METKPLENKLLKLYQTFDAFDINQPPGDEAAIGHNFGPLEVLTFKLSTLYMLSLREHGFNITDLYIGIGTPSGLLSTQYISNVERDRSEMQSAAVEMLRGMVSQAQEDINGKEEEE